MKIRLRKPEITLTNPQNNDSQSIRLGYSFTMFLFGFFVPFFRKDWKTGFILLPLDLLTMGISSVIYAWFYNASYIRRLLRSGYKIKRIKGILTSEEKQNLGLNPTKNAD